MCVFGKALQRGPTGLAWANAKAYFQCTKTFHQLTFLRNDTVDQERLWKRRWRLGEQTDFSDSSQFADSFPVCGQDGGSPAGADVSDNSIWWKRGWECGRAWKWRRCWDRRRSLADRHVLAASFLVPVRSCPFPTGARRSLPFTYGSGVVLGGRHLGGTRGRQGDALCGRVDVRGLLAAHPILARA